MLLGFLPSLPQALWSSLKMSSAKQDITNSCTRGCHSFHALLATRLPPFAENNAQPAVTMHHAWLLMPRYHKPAKDSAGGTHTQAAQEAPHAATETAHGAPPNTHWAMGAPRLGAARTAPSFGRIDDAVRGDTAAECPRKLSVAPMASVRGTADDSPAQRSS